MQKFGIVIIKGTNQQFNVVWVQNDDGFERIDIIEDLADYNPIDTSNCVASLITKRQDFVYGDIEVIKKMKNAINFIANHHIREERNVTVENGDVVMVLHKEDAKIGIIQHKVLIRGKMTSELYETPEVKIDFVRILEDRGIDSLVVNIGEYNTFSVSKDKYLDNGSSEYYSEEYLRAKHNLEHLDNYDFVVVDSMETARARLKEWADAPTKVKAIDLETTGLEWSMYGKDVIVGIVLSYSENDGTYYPFRQENFDYNLPISFIQEMLDVINSQPKDVKIIGHNAKVEIQGIWKENVHYVGNSEYARKFDPLWREHALIEPQLRINGDSFILSILVNPVFRRGIHALKSLAGRIRGQFFLELEDIFVNKNKIKFNILPPNLVKLYACADTANTIAAWNFLIQKLPKAEIGILELEAKLLYVTAENEFYGLKTRRVDLIDQIENEAYKVKILGDMFRGIHKTTKNINSNQVRQDIFYNKLGCPVNVRTKTGQPSTSNIALDEIVSNGKISDYDKSNIPKPILDLHNKVIIKGEDLAGNKYPSLVILQKYAKAMKELGALRRIERKSLRDRVMFNINQAGAATGRRTSDAHQYSNAMKGIIMADTEDFNFWSSDFKQIELRILPFLAGEEKLIELEKDPCIDIHRAILSIITGEPVWNISADDRKKGKATNFGVVYMMSAFGLAKKRVGPKPTKEDVFEAQKAINDFMNGLPKIKKFIKDNEDQIRNKGYIETAFHRFRYFKEVIEGNLSEKEIKAKVRSGNNTPVQGFGADWLKIVECNLRDYIISKGWDEKIDCGNGLWLPKVRLMLSIHDEVLVSTHKSIPHEEIITMFKVCMEMEVEGAPPFFAAPAMVNTWLDGKNDQFEVDIVFRDKIIEEWEKNHKRLLHCDSFDDDLDWLQVKELVTYCKKLRDRCLLSVEVGTSDAECSDIERAIHIIEQDKMVGRLTKHLISKEEHIKQEDILNTIAKRALDESFSPYLEDLTRFRAGRLSDYMNDLIRKYKTVDEVAAHVNHPELTHTLIAVKIKKGEKFTHMEAIHEAVRRYMEDTDISIDMYDAEEEEVEVEGISTFEELEEFIEFDQNGEVVGHEDDDLYDEAEEDDLVTYYDKDFQAQPMEMDKCIYCLDQVIIDFSEYRPTDSKAEEINQAIARLGGKDKYYKVLYFINNKFCETGIKIDYIPETINNLFKQVS